MQMPTATMTTPTETPRPELRVSAADPDSRLWVERLGSEGAEREKAIAELRPLLLRAARFQLGRGGAGGRPRDPGEAEELAQQSADDALLALLGKLDQFRGESRFTTWAFKFALLEASVKARRRAWRGREIPLEDEGLARLADSGSSAQRRAEHGELFAALGEEIAGCLSERQRQVLVAVTLNDVPIDVLAERLGSTRGALYKTLHDARRKLRAALAGRGFDVATHGEEAR
jgi:RNA polymerase sigma-70 factor, ECF subfamily